MRLGKFILSDTIPDLAANLNLISTHVNSTVTIFEKIVMGDGQKLNGVLFIGTNEAFEDCPDNIKQIPEYTIVVEESAIASVGKYVKFEKVKK